MKKIIIALILSVMWVSVSFAADGTTRVYGDLKTDIIHFPDTSILYSSKELMKNKGNWSPSLLYSAGDVVQSGGTSYVCTTANTDVPPPNSSFWSLLSSAASGLKNRGVWSSGGLYYADDVVQSGGSSYVSVATNMNQQPPNAMFWSVLAGQGATGATGTTGADGPQGATGPQGTKGDPGTVSLFSICQAIATMNPVLPYFCDPVQPPGMVQSLLVVNSSSETSLAATLSWWSPATGTIPTSYEIYRSTAAGSVFLPANKIASVLVVTGKSSYSYLDNTGLTPKATYWIVSAKNAYGETPASEISLVPVMLPKPPAAPTAFTVTGGENVATLQWTASAVSATAGLPVSYEIYRSTTATTASTIVNPANLVTTVPGMTGQTVYNFTNTGLAGATTYYYVVTAKNAGGETASTVASVMVTGVASIVLAANPVTGVINNQTPVTLTVTLTDDANGTIPNGTTVNFAIISGIGALSAASATTTAGVASVTLNSIVAGTIAVNATAGSAPVVTSNTVNVGFVTQPTLVTVKLATSGTMPVGNLIGGIQAIATASPSSGLSIQPSDVILSGVSAGSLLTPNTTSVSSVQLALINTTGIGTGEFVTLTYHVASGTFPVAGSFRVTPVSVINTIGAVIPGITVVVQSVTIQ